MENRPLFPGEEQYCFVEEKNKQQRVQYSYCSQQGHIFHCTCNSLEEAYQQCEFWLMRVERQ